MNRKPQSVVFISKLNCHLCEEMWNELMKASREVPLVIRTQIISAHDNPDYEKYREKIPSLLINGGESFRFRASAREIIEAIKKLSD